jgi:hypothetical protein
MFAIEARHNLIHNWSETINDERMGVTIPRVPDFLPANAKMLQSSSGVCDIITQKFSVIHEVLSRQMGVLAHGCISCTWVSSSPVFSPHNKSTTYEESTVSLRSWSDAAEHFIHLVSVS